ncbi:MAG: hypothetical protein WCJ19_00040 [bacterium]
MKKISKFIIILLTSFTLVNIVSAATPCPAGDQSADCVSNGFGFDAIDLRRFFPSLSFNDVISSTATIILIGLVILFGFRIILAGFKWVNNDGQDKSKKDALKGIINGVVGIAITFSAYFIVLFVRSLTAGNDQLVNCANLYYRDTNSYITNYNAGVADTFGNASEEFTRCMKLAGWADTLSASGKFSTFTTNLDNNCKQYLTSSPNSSGIVKGIEIKDKNNLQQCFVNELKKL